MAALPIVMLLFLQATEKQPKEMQAFERWCQGLLRQNHDCLLTTEEIAPFSSFLIYEVKTLRPFSGQRQ